MDVEQGILGLSVNFTSLLEIEFIIMEEKSMEEQRRDSAASDQLRAAAVGQCFINCRLIYTRHL